ncbi:hypothetical protein WMO40_21250 [Bacillaceae bacterium CLA-AA-H227]|uniref:Uncharacterized protein n=1 Tax=Robertmurraya yapensis (ex Hitch et al 2024) TaxID=3133160 RepID=A0ACC6SGG4_9BACI
MKSINPMFNRTPSQKTTSNKQSKPNAEPVQRKKRSDAKNDVKIPLSLEQRQILKQLAKRHRMSATTYCSELLGLFLRRRTDFRLVEYSPTNKKSVHAKLNTSDYDILFEYSIKWDCSLRQAAHRIITTAINIEAGGH